MISQTVKGTVMMWRMKLLLMVGLYVNKLGNIVVITSKGLSTKIISFDIVFKSFLRIASLGPWINFFVSMDHFTLDKFVQFGI